MTILPGRKRNQSYRDLTADVTRIHQHYMCTVLITLVEEHEIAPVDHDMPATVVKAGMESIRFPFRDKWVPPSMERFAELIFVICSRLKQGWCTRFVMVRLLIGFG
jgi:hypothetical protein